ncbi:hypothetical protein DdX_13529 [Ditylenchus destructor]|uniref:Uncharacterized protein n=1 Tax=Ditylenchus destructor TaxID=166010 RepID=A0AAD4MV41_9BILA|nr:hypothetical protein DdX_13529 [Ditylenchus destructor]
MSAIKNCYCLLILATFLGCFQLIPIQRKVKENLKSDLGIAKDLPLSDVPTEKRLPQMSQSGKIPTDIQLLIKDQRSSVISPHTPTEIRNNVPEEKVALNDRLVSGSPKEETAAERNFRSTKKSVQTPPQDNAPNQGIKKKRAPQLTVLTALSPHLFPMAEFFPNNGGILHPVNFRG